MRQSAIDGAAYLPALGFLLVLAAFWPTVVSFAGLWGQDGMSHGWVIGALVAWLIWRDHQRFALATHGDALLLLPLAALSLLWLVATTAYVRVIHQTAFTVLLVCWALLVFHRRSRVAVAALGLTFLLALPLWSIAVPILRRLTTVASGGVVRVLGIPADIQGDIIRIPSGTFLVENGCSGINYLLSGLVIAAVYAHVLVRDRRAQLRIVAWAALIAIVGNWVRVAALIVIGHVTEMRSGLMQSHGTFGWAIFTAGLVPFFFIAHRIERRAAATAATSEADHAAGEGHATGAAEHPSGRTADTEASAAGPEARDPVRRLALATAVAAMGPLLYFGIGALPSGNVETPGLAAVARGDGWRAAPPSVEVPSWRPAYEGATEHETLSFTDGTTRIDAHRFLYLEQGQGAKLVGYPNRIAAPADVVDERVVGPVGPEGTRWVRQALIRTPDGPLLTWYWYRVGGTHAFHPLHAKALEVAAFVRRHRASELIALSTPCDPESGCAEALRALSRLMGGREGGVAPDPEV